MVLRSKLNYNKGDFERLRRLGQQAGGALGKDLERVVEQADKLSIEIVQNKKDQHKGLIEIREVMRCDIGTDQKPFTPDTKQIENMCKILNEKDTELYQQLMTAKDNKEKEYLANQVANGLRDIMNGDKVDVEQHITFNNSGIEKLQKMLEKHESMKQKQAEIFESQQKTKVNMKEQVKYLDAEKREIHRKIEIAKKELAELQAKLQKILDDIHRKDEIIADLDIKIDLKYDEMEELEHLIAGKELEIKDLQMQLAAILNKKTPIKFTIYKPVKDDEVDLKLAEMINIHGSPVPWIRDSAGNYKYGSKRVNVKYLRSNLIIKVGGGSMNFEEFVQTYEDIELAKLNF